MSVRRWTDVRIFVITLVVAGFGLSAVVVPGAFSIDDSNYMVNVVMLRQGAVSMPNTAGLPPSSELAAFDPNPWGRRIDRTPVPSTAPPLYAFLAWPFSWMGWRGLVALNTLSFLLATAIVFAAVRRHTSARAPAWVAALAFSVGAFTLDYALGVWPHALSMALVVGGIVLAHTALSARLVWLGLAGCLLGLAAGVRYPNAVILAATGCSVWVFATRRWLAATVFGVGAALPIAASSLINHARFGSWNPISKGPGYLGIPEPTNWWDPAVMFWARMVDYSVRPPVKAFEAWSTYDPWTGAHLMLGITLKKAILQSAPWVGLAVLALLLAWRPGAATDDGRRHLLRFLTLPILGILGIFAVAGVGRDDGLSFNQRYLLELIPLSAIALGIIAAQVAPNWRVLGVGALCGGAMALIALLGPWSMSDSNGLTSVARQVAILRVPLGVAMLLVVLGAGVLAGRPWSKAAGLLLGVSIGWASVVHLTEDVLTGRMLRTRNLLTTRALARVVPERAAIFTYWGAKDAVLPLVADVDLVVVDAKADEGKDAPRLMQAFREARRRVFVLETGFPSEVLAAVTGNGRWVQVKADGVKLREIIFDP